MAPIKQNVCDIRKQVRNEIWTHVAECIWSSVIVKVQRPAFLQTIAQVINPIRSKLLSQTTGEH